MSQKAWTLTQLIGYNGMDTVVICSADNQHKVQVYLFGATIVSWISNNQEQLYVSPNAVYDNCKAIRGGIPIVFPQFSQPDLSLPQHGFARTSLWTHKDELSMLDSDCAEIILELTDNAITTCWWNYQFKLQYKISVTEKSLSCTLVIHNTGNVSFHCQSLLHTYIRVGDIHGVKIAGFQNRRYIDKMNSSVVNEIGTADVIDMIDCEVDRIILPPTSPTIVITKEDATSVCLYHTAVVNDTEMEHDVVFWNPWITKASALVDLGEGEFKNFVCIEPGIVSNAVVLEADGVMHLNQVLTVV